MRQLERLAEMALRRADPAPLDVGGVMNRVRGLDIDDGSEILPLRFFAGGAIVAAAAAVFVIVLGVSAWQDMSDPTITQFESLISLLDAMDGW